MSTIETPALVPELRHVLRESRGDRQTFAAPAQIAWRTPTGADATGDGTYTFTGRAVVYEEWTTLLSVPGWTIKEKISAGALTAVLAAGPKTHFNHSHDMGRVMARATVIGAFGDVARGGMKLTETKAGLDVFARLNPNNHTVQALAVEMEDALVQEMSFAFRIGQEVWVEEYDEETETWTDSFDIQVVSDLFDVCACAQGAYPTTSGSLRDALAEMRHAGIDLAGARRRHLTSRGTQHDTVTPQTDAAGDEAWEAERQLASLRARAAASRLTHRLPKGTS